MRGLEARFYLILHYHRISNYVFKWEYVGIFGREIKRAAW